MKISQFSEIIDRFYGYKKYKFYSLFPLSLIAGLFEYFGLILIFQFVLFLSGSNSEYCKSIIDFFSNVLNITEIPKISLFLGVAIALIYIFKNIYMLFFTKLNNEILQDLSVEITTKTMKNILFCDYLKVTSTSKEEKINILSKVSFVVWQYCYKYINLIINCTIALILIVYLFVKFTIPAIIAVVFITALSFLEYKYLKIKSNFQNKHFSKSFDELNSVLLKVINSLKEIKLNNKQEYFIDKIKSNSQFYSNLNKERAFCDIFHIYFTEISVMFTFILVLGTLFYTTNFDNHLLISSISTICVIILRLTPTINRAQSSLYAINSNKNVAQELIDFDKQFDNEVIDKQTKEKLSFNNNLELKNVFFKYSNDNKGLSNVNLVINKNDFIGIVGASGCYKTTLSLIIAGLIKPIKGEIMVDGNVLTSENISKWQNNIALLGQDFEVLFENTNNLSSGEKQKFAFEKLLLGEKEILILDEFTSSLDVIAQEKINGILKSLIGKKTIITIAHRFQILKHCNKIIYMKNGEIIDIDTFKNLNNKYDEFKKMVELSNFQIN